MPYSVVTAQQACSTEMVNLIIIMLVDRNDRVEASPYRHGDRMRIFDRQQITSNYATIFVSNITNEQPVEYVQKLAMFSDPKNNI